MFAGCDTRDLGAAPGTQPLPIERDEFWAIDRAVRTLPRIGAEVELPAATGFQFRDELGAAVTQPE
jgi:hypothetical protein